ncbi:hypothetical protein Q3G72_013977 [Acer saccharum]|nr:hypothetical protein Q3G72_013977 [Acer saccharum]
MRREKASERSSRPMGLDGRRKPMEKRKQGEIPAFNRVSKPTSGSSLFEEGQQSLRSFAEVMKGPHGRNKMVMEDPREVNLSMIWKRQPNVEEWLDRCAIGVLKEFTSVASVCNKLHSREFPFSTSYLGDKCIVWCFDSTIDKDCFFSMSRSSNAWTSKKKLIRIPLWIDSETFLRLRMDKGKSLALIPHDGVNTFKVNVAVDERSFLVKMEADPQLVSQSWL